MYRMKPFIINPAKRVYGSIVMPGDKSISHRAIMIGAIARGLTRIKDVLNCDDCNFTIQALRQTGVDITKKGSWTIVKGRGLRGLKQPKGALDVGESGTSIRLLAGLFSGQNICVTLDGDTSLLNRPMMRIAEPLRSMGVDIMTATGGYPPLKIHGGTVNPIDYRIPIASAQVKSAILLASIYARGRTTVTETFKSRDHTERMLRYFGAKLKVSGRKISVNGGSELKGRTVCVPGDISSASFFIAAATILSGSKIRIKNVSINPTRAGIIDVISRMGGKIKISNKTNAFEPTADIEVASAPTSGIIIKESEIPGIIDELPIIFVLAALSKGRTIIKGARELRVKETDRINSMKTNLEKMGSKVDVEGDKIVIAGGGGLKGSQLLRSFGDHRTCMAMAVAALGAEGSSKIDNVECVDKSFPEFFKYLKKIVVARGMRQYEK